MSLAVAIDFGTTSTCVAVAVDGGQPRIVVIDGNPLMPSAVYADGRALFVGAEAERMPAQDSSRYEPTPKRRIDEGELLLGDTVVTVARVIAAVLGRAVEEARNLAGGAEVDGLVLTHPAEWGPHRIQQLAAAAAGLAARVTLMPEPVAAAVQLGGELPAGATVAILDVGAGTTDVSVLRKEGGGFRVLAARSNPRFGGADVDQLLVDELGRRQPPEHRATWQAITGAEDPDAGTRRRALRSDVRVAKESLSRHSYVDVPLPGGLAEGHVTRADLERLLATPATAVVDLLRAALADAEKCAVGAADGTTPDAAGARSGPHQASDQVTLAIFLVGGTARIPLFATMVHRSLGVVPVSTDQPETVVVRGALRALAADSRPAQPPPASAAGPRAPEPGGPTVAALSARSVGRRCRRLTLAGLAVLLALTVGIALAVWPDQTSGARLVTAGRVSFAVPADWQEARRTSLGSTAGVDLSPDGTAANATGLFLVQTALEAALSAPELAIALQEQIATEATAGKRYEAFAAAARYADRELITYREIRRDGRVVDWYVWAQDRTQVSVGCQHGAGGADTLTRPCEQAVRSVRVG